MIEIMRAGTNINHSEQSQPIGGHFIHPGSMGQTRSGGATMSTGTWGLDGTAGRPLAYPVLAKGMGEGDHPANLNTNWLLAITSTGVIGADFEDTAGGVNRPAWGTTR